MKLKKIISVFLTAVMLLSASAVAAFAETAQEAPVAITNLSAQGLYAHGVLGNSDEAEAWQIWQWNNSKKGFCFYLPSGADSSRVEIYNNSDKQATVNGTVIAPYTSSVVAYTTDKAVDAVFNDSANKVIFMRSTAEAAVYINNLNADGNGKGLWEYLSEDKSNSASATGAIVDKNGAVDNTTVKKIKGRGNTTWYKDKKPFNITYNDRVSIGGMEKGKKYSFLANYQDASLSRNRFLYDLSDSVGMPYASDSRYVDFYVDGKYYGSYQAAQKIDTGKGSLLADIDDTGYLNSDGTVAEDFQFVCEVDASAGDEDYYFDSASGNKITLKTPELDKGDPNYDEVLSYAKSKFDPLFDRIKQRNAQLDDLIDVDSLTKIFLINELGKNWDSGVSSLYFTYKQDKDGNWKFFASPVWDYDNSLGNATGVASELNAINVTDYEEPTGWWCRFKGNSRSSRATNNIMNYTSKNTTVLNNAPRIWFEYFVPAINAFENNTSMTSFYPREKYYSLVSGSAEMNYTFGWSLNTGSWICDHSSLNLCSYDYSTKTFTQDTVATKYDTNTFKGEFDYAADWLVSRAAWLSSQFADSYKPTFTLGDANLDGVVDVTDATYIQKAIAGGSELSESARLASDVNKDGIIDIIDVTRLQEILAS